MVEMDENVGIPISLPEWIKYIRGLDIDLNFSTIRDRIVLRMPWITLSLGKKNSVRPRGRKKIFVPRQTRFCSSKR